MADDLEIETDKLLAELGISSGGGAGAPSSKPPPVPPPPAAAGSVPPPPPPPPPAASTSSSTSSSIKLKTNSGGLKPAVDAQKEINEIFDSVISFAGKTSKKKVPPPVAPKPKRKIHVSSYTMQVKSPGAKKDTAGIPSKPEPPKIVAVSQAPPPPPPPAPAAVTAPPPVKSSSKPTEPEPSPQIASEPIPKPIPMVAFGPGLETVEVNCFGDFQVSCTPDTTVDDLEVTVKGPSGSKPVEITEHGNGQFSCSYLPTFAGDHVISIKVEGEHIQGSPYTAHVKFAAYTDKCSAEGPGLVSGSTTEPCRFKIRSKDEAGYARMRIHVVGPSKAEPIEMEEDAEEKCVNVAYHPSAPGDYTIRVLWGEANVHGSPFTVPVTGETVNDPSKVMVSGDGLNGGKVDEPLKIFVEGEAGAGPGPLGIRMVGPSKPTITADDSSEEGVELTLLCRDPGEYQLILKWGNDEVPSSPYPIKITGEGRQVHPELCTASGDGIKTGQVGEPAKFKVDIPDEAGPGTLGVSVAGAHPPKPIEIVNNQDGTMEVTYHPLAPGEYKIDLTWAEQHIKGSPFTAVVTGDAVRNPKEVHAEGEIIKGTFMKCNQLGTISVKPGGGAGAGPLRAKLEGPSKADLQLTANQDGTMLVSFIPKDSGHYKLHLLWGGEDEKDEIAESPFLIKVEK